MCGQQNNIFPRRPGIRAWRLNSRRTGMCGLQHIIFGWVRHSHLALQFSAAQECAAYKTLFSGSTGMCGQQNMIFG
jgi:hypothetical protein